MDRKLYRGFTIRTNPITGAVWIERDSHLISWAKDVTDAVAQINVLTNPRRINQREVAR